MRQFVPKFQGRPWVSGEQVLHVYVCPRAGVDDELLRLVGRATEVMAPYPIDPQAPHCPADPGWLHLTVEMVADAPSAAISGADRAGLVKALADGLADFDMFETEVGPPIANVAGAVLDVWPDRQAVALQDRVRSVLRAVRGDRAVTPSADRPHLSLGYACAAADSDPLNSVLRTTITPRRAPLLVDRVHVVDVTWAYESMPGGDGWQMSWTPVAEIPLRGADPALPATT
ncbi:2'-5' RNA ligase family protein [Streptomyces sp. NPDC088775]|uniref:2'-5' RNA ligase family protein n=1 Tax=Streptomyces sp. NPDC088775 TaxID=3365896 RepID=UPI003804C272